MKILMVSEDVPYKPMGGLALHALTLARTLVETGHKVDFLGNNLFVPDECGEQMDFGGTLLCNLNARHATWKEPQLGFYNYYRRDFMARRFARAILCHANDYDVVHYHGHIPIIANYIPCNVNFVQTRHDHGSECLRQIRFRHHGVCHETTSSACAGCAHPAPGRLRTRLSAASVDRFRSETARAFHRHKTIFVSHALRDNFERYVSNLPPDSRNYVVHNFVDFKRISALAHSHQARSSRTLEVLIVTALYEAKGVDVFLKTLTAGLHAGLRVSIIGQGEEAAVLQQRYTRDNIVFLGWHPYPEVIRAISACDIAVVPSILEEPCSTTVLEALALGKLTYALRRGGTPELAAYQRFDQQLRLFDTMPDLVNGLLTEERSVAAREREEYSTFDGDVRRTISKLLDIYAI